MRIIRPVKNILIASLVPLLICISSYAGTADIVPRSSRPSAILEVLDVRQAPPDERLMAACVQGLVNRSRPRIYLFATSSDAFWLEVLKQRGLVRRTDNIRDIQDLVQRHKDMVKGLVIPDPDLPATVNVATMICAVRGCLISSPRLAKLIDIPVKADLRGRWGSSVEAYEWVYDNLLRLLSKEGAAWACPTETFHTERDYLIQHKLWTFWISGSNEANRPRVDPDGERRLVERALRALPANIPIFGCPDYEESGIGDKGGATIASAYGTFNVCTGLCSNLSVHSGYNAPTLKQKPLPKEKFDAGKVYVSFIVSDGNDISALQERLLHSWRDTARGGLPIAWCISPIARLLVPEIVRYYYRSSDADDRFVCAMTGAGGMYPGVYGAKLDRPALMTAYAGLTGELCKPLDISILCMDNYLGTWTPHIQTFADNSPNLGAIFADNGRRTGMTYIGSRYRLMRGKLPPMIVVHALLELPLEEGREALIDTSVSQIKDATSVKPAFLNCFIANQFITPSDIQEIMRRLGPDYVAVPPEKLVAFSSKYTLQAADEKNLALSAKVSSPDGIGQDNRPNLTEIENDRFACDGDYSTYWNEEAGKDEYILYLRLDKKSAIRRITIVGLRQEDHAPKSFDIVCDGEIVQRVSNLEYRDNRAEVTFRPTICKTFSLRIRESYGSSPAIREIAVYSR